MGGNSAFLDIRGHTIYTPALGQNPVVVDFGANHGDFSKLMKQRFGGTYYVAEANPVLARALSDEKLFHVWHCAVTGREGTVDFNISPNDEGSSLLGKPSDAPGARVTVMGRTIPSLLAEIPFAAIDLMKVDIEGAEGQALVRIPAASLANIGQITVEFHSDPSFGLDITREVNEAIRYLKRNGFVSVNFSGTVLSDVLFINRRRCKISFLQAKKWEWAGARPQWLRHFRSVVPRRARQALNRFLDKLAGRSD